MFEFIVVMIFVMPLSIPFVAWFLLREERTKAYKQAKKLFKAGLSYSEVHDRVVTSGLWGGYRQARNKGFDKAFDELS